MKMTNQHPITPPPELVREWQREANHNEAMFPQVATFAARWGADQELEACCDWLIEHGYNIASPELRAARRSEPSLKEQALSLISDVCGLPMMRTYSPDELLILRRALEALPND